MKTYNTYQEAKIDNPNSEIFVKQIGLYTNQFTIESFGGKPCNPKDYCITLESFLASGKKLVRGDLFIGFKGKVSTVVSPEVMNVPQDVDNYAYILKAKALENPAHEWVNGDECVHVDRHTRVCTYIGKHPYVNGHFVLSEKGSVRYVNDNCLRKPETTEQKLERERRELISDTCEELFGDLPEQLRPDVVGTIEVMLDAGYRKETKS